MSKKFAIVLARVSTESQDYEPQVKQLIQYGKEKGYTNFKVIGTKETGLADLNEKVGTSEMFQFIKKHPKYNTVFATEMSRLGRRQSVLHAVKDWFVENKVQLYVADADFWLFTKQGTINQWAEMGFTLQALLAESEIKQKKDRFRRKRLDLMAKGYSFGSKTLFGYDLEPVEGGDKKKFVRHKTNASIVQTIYDWYLNGFDSFQNPSIKRITLKCMKEGMPKYTHSKRNVNKLLKEDGYTGLKHTKNKRKNPMYGRVTGEEEYIHTQSIIRYPQIITQEIFDAVQEKLQSNRSSVDRITKRTTVLAKLIQCPSCSRKLSANYRFQNGTDKSSYRCTSRSGATPCENTKSISMNLIDSAVWSYIKCDYEALSKQIKQLNPNVDLLELHRQLENLEKRRSEFVYEAETIKKMMEGFKKIKSLDFEDFLTNNTNRINKIDRDVTLINQEMLRIENAIQSIENTRQDSQSIVEDNLDSIESSKEQVKRYINHFVDNISIIQQDRKYTVVELKIKDYTRSSFAKVMDTLSKGSIIIDQYAYLIIDKRVTRDVKVWKHTQHGSEDTYIHVKGMATLALRFLLNAIDEKRYGDAEPIPFRRLDFGTSASKI